MNKLPHLHISHWILVFVTVIVTAMAVSCYHNSPMDKQLDRAENLMAQYPDSALGILELIDAKQIVSQSDKASYGLKINRARLLCDKTIAQDKWLDFSISYYKEKNDSVDLSEALQLASIRSRHRFNQDSSLLYLKWAVDLIPDNQKIIKSQLLTRMAYQLSRPSARKDYIAAIDYSKQALGYATTTDEKARALHDIGVLYSFIGKNDSCLSYIEKALEQIDPKNHLYANFARNYAATPGADFIKSKNLLSAVRSESVGDYVTLGFLYLNNGLLDSAAVEIQKAYSRYSAAPENYSINTLNNLRLLDGCVNYGYHKAVNFSKGVITNDSISEVMNLEQRLSNESQETSICLQKEMLENRIAHQRVWIWLLATIFISVLIIFAVYYVWLRKYRRLQQQLGQERVSQIILETADNPLDEDALHAIISKRIRLCIESFRNSGYYSRLQKVSADKHDDGFLPLKQRAEIQKKMLECFSDFVIDLKNDGVKLNLDDILFCLFSLLAIDNKTISRCMGVSEGALRTRKSRLKSKLSSFMYQILFHESND